MFGNAFGSGLATGPKLKSFAAPAAVADFETAQKPRGSSKPIGSSADDEAENEDGESGDERSEGKRKDEETSEADERFQPQGGESCDSGSLVLCSRIAVETGEDNEETIFSSNRASLYHFKKGGWQEAGKGVFKLNVPKGEPEDGIPGMKPRFLMRAHQTFRLLVNAPIQADLNYGDWDGKEPKFRTFHFGQTADKGPVQLYQVKVSGIYVISGMKKAR